MEKLPKFYKEQELAERLKTPESLEGYERLHLGEQIKKLRRKLGLKQAAFAKKLKTSQSAVARIEAGKQNLSLRLLVRLGFALGKKISIKFL